MNVLNGYKYGSSLDNQERLSSQKKWLYSHGERTGPFESVKFEKIINEQVAASFIPIELNILTRDLDHRETSAVCCVLASHT